MKRDDEKHIAYSVVMEGLEKAQECPLCWLEADCLDRYVDSLLYERVNDRGVRQELARSRGFCTGHAFRLLDRSGAFGISILYEAQLRNLVEHLQKGGEGSRVLRSKTDRSWVAHEHCPACRLQHEARERYIQVLLDGLAGREMRTTFSRSPCLCVPHLFMVLSRARVRQERELIRTETVAKYSQLLADLQEFQRKNDWRFAHEAMGSEGNSWAKAVRALAGGSALLCASQRLAPWKTA